MDDDLISKKKEIENKYKEQFQKKIFIEDSEEKESQLSIDNKEFLLKKYFTYSNENISGAVYWIRQIINIFLIMFFGLGIYLMGLTSYKRAKAFEMSHENAMLMAILMPLCIFIAYFIAQTDSWALANLFMLPHAIFIFKNGNRDQKDTKTRINPFMRMDTEEYEKVYKENQKLRNKE